MQQSENPSIQSKSELLTTKDLFQNVADLLMNTQCFEAQKDSIKILNVIIQQNPLDHVSLFKRGYCRIQVNQSGRASKDLTSAIEIKSDVADYFAHRARTFLWSDDDLKALGDCQKALQLQPNHSLALCLSGFFKSKLKQKSKAIIDIDLAKAISPTNDMVFFCRGWVYRWFKDWSATVKELDNAIALQQYPRYYSYRGSCYYIMDRYQNAVEDFTKAIELDPSHWLYYSYRAYAFEKIHKAAEAQQDLKKKRMIQMKYQEKR